MKFDKRSIPLGATHFIKEEGFQTAWYKQIGTTWYVTYFGASWTRSCNSEAQMNKHLRRIEA